MQCENCGFLVPKALKFSLMKNLCPACGTQLFSEKTQKHLKLISNKLKNQPFARDLNEVNRYDCALFIHNEILAGLEKSKKEQESLESGVPIELADEMNDENLQALENTDFDFDKDAILKEVAKEFESGTKQAQNKRIMYEDDFENQSADEAYVDESRFEDMNDDAARLLKMHKQNMKILDKRIHPGGVFRRSE